MRLFIAFLVICCVGCSQSSRYIESEPTSDLFLYGWYEYGNLLPLFGVK